MEETDVSNKRRNILGVILLVVAVGAFVYFAVTSKPKEVYKASNIIEPVSNNSVIPSLNIKGTTETIGQAPIVQTDAQDYNWQCGTLLKNNNVCLMGEFVANGLPTKAWFEYGTLRNSLKNSTSPQDVGSGSGFFKEQIYFKPNTQYYVRIVAKNSTGTTRGEIVAYSVAVTK